MNYFTFQASLTLQSEAQTVLTKRLIKKIGDFSCNNPGTVMQFNKVNTLQYFVLLK